MFSQCSAPDELPETKPNDKLWAGNETKCQTPPVICQAAYKRRMAERLHPNVVTKQEIARECWQSSIVRIHINGYISSSMYICATSSSALCSSCEYTLTPAGQHCHHSRRSHQVSNGQHSWTEAATLVTITACCCMMAIYR